MEKFGISQPVRRREDARLLTGRGRFADDRALPGMVHGFVLRSPYAHARIRAIDTRAADAAPGVLAVLTGEDIHAAGIKPINSMYKFPPKPGTEFREHGYPVLARETARYAGDGVAFVIAETTEAARDAAERIEVDYEPLAAVVDCAAALKADAPRIWPDVPGNLMFQWVTGDTAATDAAFAGAAHVARLEVVNNRIVQNPMEPRSALGEWDAGAGRYTLTSGTQMPHSVRDQLAHVFAGEKGAFRVVVEDVGGGFGGKNGLYPEQVLVLMAARRVGRPVKWTAERSEAFLSDSHGRDNLTRGEMALDADGRILAIRVFTLANIGAYAAPRGNASPILGVVMTSGVYVVPTLAVEVHGVYTNTTPTDVYRGAGRPEVTYLVERLIDAAAHDLGIERIALRRRNLIPPEAFPYVSPAGIAYDACDFARVLDAAIKASHWDAFKERRNEAARRGKRRGIGLASYVERCGGGGGFSEEARLAFDADGSATLFIGTMSNGQGHDTAYSQIIAEALGLPFERIRIVQGDTDRIMSGHGTGGSWSIPAGGGAVWQAAERIIDKARHLAAHALEAGVRDIEFNDGAFRVTGTDLAITFSEVVRIAFAPERLPPGIAPGLDETAVFKPGNYTFPNGCHVCEVEVDPATGTVAVVGYAAVHDFGRALNPLLLAGQVHGGVTQGIGQALLERTVFDEHGQLVTGSFMDYGVPRADDLPDFDFVECPTPTARNPLGVKGCGEAGATGAPPAVINALCDALRVRHIDMPATPERVWRALAQ